MFYNHEESKGNKRMGCVLSSMVINFERGLTLNFHDDRRTKDIPRDFALKIGLLHW